MRVGITHRGASGVPLLRASGTPSGDHRLLQGAFPTTERGADA
jgi:hypothetical protein